MRIKEIFNAINIFYIATLIAVSYKLTYSVCGYWDILGADEVTYLKFGKNLFHELHFEWGFLYTVWYKFLAIFEPSTIKLYYLNYKVLITIVPVIIFICLLVYGINSTIAFVISFLYLISKLHVTTWPFVSNFCILFFLGYFIVIRFMKDDNWKFIVLAFFSLLLYFIRPEFSVAFICATLLSLYQNRDYKKRWLLLLLLWCVFFFTKSTTTIVSGIERGFFAYVQHYAFTYKLWNKDSHLSFYDFIDLVPKLFGKSQTLISSLLYNPIEALRHLATTTGFYILSFIKNTEDLLLPFTWFKCIGKLKHLLFICLLVAGFLFYKYNKPKGNIANDKVLKLSLIILFIAGLVPNFLIGYNPHYFQLHFILYVLFFSILLFKNKQFNIKSWMSLALGIFFFFTTPTIKNYTMLSADFTESKNLPIQKLALLVNKINDNKSHCLLAFQTNTHFVFDGNNFTSYDVFSINKPFLGFIKLNKVDFIYINKQMLDDERLNKDEGWKSFINQPEKYGFIKKELVGSKNYLLIKF